MMSWLWVLWAATIRPATKIIQSAPIAADRLAGAGAHALDLTGVARHFGALVAQTDINLRIAAGERRAVLGSNGAGNSTLCKAITGLTKARSGSIRVNGRDVTSLQPHEIHRLGVGYVPQGRRVWPRLTVDEHLRLASGKKDAVWTIDRVYSTFPRLAERRGNGGSQLSGGEQQILAISRALLRDPKLLVMDEPTEGLAPVIVQRVQEMLITLGAKGDMAILVIEQNIGVATAISDRVAIMVNGQINRIMDAAALAADRDLQQRLLGVRRQADEVAAPEMVAQAQSDLAEVYRVDRGDGAAFAPVTALPNRWNLPVAELRKAGVPLKTEPNKAIFAIPFAERIGETVLLAGTFDTKGAELRFMADRLKTLGIPVKTVDLSTSRKPTRVDIPAGQVAASHPARGQSGDDRRPGRIGFGDGRSLCDLGHPTARHWRRVVGGRVGRHLAGHRRNAGAAGGYPENHGLDRRLG